MITTEQTTHILLCTLSNCMKNILEIGGVGRHWFSPYKALGLIPNTKKKGGGGEKNESGRKEVYFTIKTLHWNPQLLGLPRQNLFLYLQHRNLLREQAGRRSSLVMLPFSSVISFLLSRWVNVHNLGDCRLRSAGFTDPEITIHLRVRVYSHLKKSTLF